MYNNKSIQMSSSLVVLSLLATVAINLVIIVNGSTLVADQQAVFHQVYYTVKVLETCDKQPFRQMDYASKWNASRSLLIASKQLGMENEKRLLDDTVPRVETGNPPGFKSVLDWTAQVHPASLHEGLLKYYLARNNIVCRELINMINLVTKSQNLTQNDRIRDQIFKRLNKLWMDGQKFEFTQNFQRLQSAMKHQPKVYHAFWFDALLACTANDTTTTTTVQVNDRIHSLVQAQAIPIFFTRLHCPLPDDDHFWADHLAKVTANASDRLKILKKLYSKVDNGTTRTMYEQFINCMGLQGSPEPTLCLVMEKTLQELKRKQNSSADNSVQRYLDELQGRVLLQATVEAFDKTTMSTRRTFGGGSCGSKKWLQWSKEHPLAMALTSAVIILVPLIYALRGHGYIATPTTPPPDLIEKVLHSGWTGPLLGLAAIGLFTVAGFFIWKAAKSQVTKKTKNDKDNGGGGIKSQIWSRQLPSMFYRSSFPSSTTGTGTSRFSPMDMSPGGRSAAAAAGKSTAVVNSRVTPTSPSRVNSIPFGSKVGRGGGGGFSKMATSARPGGSMSPIGSMTAAPPGERRGPGGTGSSFMSK